MRVFIGIKVPEALENKIEEFVSQFKRPQERIHWISPQNLHITLVPPR